MDNKFDSPKKIPNKIKDERKAFVNYILDRVKQGKGIWEKKWDVAALQPERQDTGKQYRGKNRYKLAMKTAAKGYNDNRWYTFKQVQELKKTLDNNKIHVKAGEKSTTIDFWKFETKKDIQEEFIIEAKKAKAKAEGKEDYKQTILPIEDFKVINDKVEEKMAGRKSVFQFQSSYVFNAAQIEGLPPKKLERKTPSDEEIERMIDTLIESSETPVKFAMQEKAFYSPSENKIVLPSRESFESDRHCLATLLHEMGHSYMPKVKEGEKQDSYAVEELKAEFTSLFVQGELGVNLADESVLENSAEYIKAWGEELLDNPSALDNIIKDAQARANAIAEEYKAVMLEEKVIGFFDAEKVEDTEDKKKIYTPEEVSDIVKKVQEGLKTSYLYGTPEDNDYVFDEAMKALDDKKQSTLIDSIESFMEFNGKRFFISLMEPVEFPNETLHLTKSEVESIEKDGVKKFVEDNKEMLQKKYEPQVKEFIRQQAEEFWDKKVPAFGKNSEWVESKEYVKTKLRMFFREIYADDNFKGKNRDSKEIKVNFEPLVKKSFEERKAKLEQSNEKVASEAQARTN